MSDLEITRLCAEAMEYSVEEKFNSHGHYWRFSWESDQGGKYDPLHDDAQAMALVKKFSMEIYTDGAGIWHTTVYNPLTMIEDCKDLNRAICECVAKMQKAKERA